ncbi:MAG: ABC transporter permease subunit [Streptosporangiales bacterium]|nr:ABC transporter permease subunit [Streptosporangiales bacterium]
MSVSETRIESPRPARESLRPHAGGLFLAELRLTFRRLRTVALLAGFAAVPILLGVVIRIASEPGEAGEGPNLIGNVAQNGVFLVFVSLFFLLPLFLPVGVAVIAGDSLAGEAHLGTLRYLLVAPAGRVRLLAAKLVAVLAFCVAAAFTVFAVATIVGLVLFPRGDVPLLTGTTISYADGVGRGLLVAGYVALSLTGIGAIGVFASTLTEAPLGAMAVTVAVPLASQILDVVPQLAVIGPYLPTHHWMSLADLLRDPIHTPNLVAGLVLQLVYVLVFSSAAYARMTTRDVA